VTSAVVLIEPRAEPLPCAVAALEAVTRAAFGQRRKMLRQSLKSVTPEPGPILEAVGIPGTARAEEVPVAGFIALANAIRRARSA
jgi:16S rRNA (adenine1518-N6/adenine1519-N6)-dimethyltransferase